MKLNPRAGQDWGALYAVVHALTNRMMGNGGLAVGTTNTRVKTANAIAFSIAGKTYTLAATDPITDFDGSLTNTASGQFCKLRLEINSGGTVSAVQGPMAAAQVLAPVPPRSESKCTIGWVEIPESFTFGTSVYDAAGVTFYNGDPDLTDETGPLPANRGVSAKAHVGA